MDENIEFIKIYFTELKIESLFFIFIGVIAICLALIFWFIIKYSFYKGFAYPLLIIGIVQLTVGSIRFFKADYDVKRIEFYNVNKNEYLLQNELPRMEMVTTNFTLFIWIEIVLILLGVFLYFYFKPLNQVFWKGLGLGLFVQAVILLSLDLVAEKRNQTYMSTILKIVSTK